MQSPTCGLRVASVVFGLVCLGHLLRIMLRLEIHIGAYSIHRWMSAIVVVIAALLCVWLWMLAGQEAAPAAKSDAAPAKP